MLEVKEEIRRVGVMVDERVLDVPQLAFTICEFCAFVSVP